MNTESPKEEEHPLNYNPKKRRNTNVITHHMLADKRYDSITKYIYIIVRRYVKNLFLFHNLLMEHYYSSCSQKRLEQCRSIKYLS